MECAVIRKYEMPAFVLMGWNVVYVGRPSPFGNPFVIGKDGTRAEVVEKYRAWIAEPEQEAERDYITKLALTGENIAFACWCAPKACHADVLKEMLIDEWKFFSLADEHNYVDDKVRLAFAKYLNSK